MLFVPTTETTFLYSSGKESSVTPCLIETALASSSLETKSYSYTELLKYWFSNSEPSFFFFVLQSNSDSPHLKDFPFVNWMKVYSSIYKDLEE